ncbi:divergent protein kinase domain 1C-like [Lineus longissimus]|uniref:divergent protein kinase domain 1C-like n=1 Tax=Lineus longissimus TaxID=88925 RepID=UPI002B4F6935
MKVLQWRKQSVIKLVIFLIAVLTLGYLVHWIVADITGRNCNDKSSKQILDSMCHLWEKNKVGGNLCEDICKLHSIRYTSCLNYKRGKKVFNATWNMKAIIMKSKKAYFEDYKPLVTAAITEDGKDKREKSGEEYPSFEDFAVKIQERIHEQLGKTGQRGQFDMKRIFNDFWSTRFDDYFTNSYQKNAKVAGLNSINSLLQQDEYVLMKQVQHSKYFPQIYGTCGHFYIMEYVPQGEVLLPKIIGLGDSTTWNQRRLLAIKLLDFVHHFEHNLPEPLHLCDVKNKNFGITQSGQVKAIDVDLAFFDKKLKQFLSTEKCTKHSECDFFDCKGWCDFKTNQCTERRINNNLQVFCAKIFSPHLVNGFRGLLRNPPAKLNSLFEKLLDDCRNPWNIQDRDIRLKTPDGTFWKLHRLLQQSSADYFPYEKQELRHGHDHEH